MRPSDWNYTIWKSFQNKLYQKSLTTQNITENGQHELHTTLYKISEGTTTEITIQPPESRTIIKLTKNNKKYLLPAHHEKSLPIKPGQTFKCQLTLQDKKIWEFITQPTILSINPILPQNHTLKMFIKNWNPQPHTNPTHWTLLKVISLASKYKSIKLCICSEPSTGKSSNFTIMQHITQDIMRIQKPTLAKLETVLYYNRVVLPDEITSMAKTDLQKIEPVILAIADQSTEYQKHSMATDTKLNTIDLTSLSIIFTYNRLKDMNKNSKFFDDKWDNIQAFQSRYPQLLLRGKIESTLPTLNTAQANQLMETNFESMKSIAKEFVYWTQNLQDHLHHWNTQSLSLPPRHQTNMEGVLEVLDVLSDSQAEMDYWLSVLNDCLSSYQRMLVGTSENDQNQALLVSKENIVL